MTKPNLKAVTADSEKSIPEDQVEMLRQIDAAVSQALAELGIAHLNEQAARRDYDQASSRLDQAEDQAREALSQQKQVNEILMQTMELEDGTWDIDLGAGKLVRSDVRSED